MVEAVQAQQTGPFLSTPTTKRGFACPLMMTEGNTHIVYASREMLVFRGRNGAPDFIFKEFTKKITSLGKAVGGQYYFGDEQGCVNHFTFTAEGVFELKNQLSMVPGPIHSVEYFHGSKEMTAKIFAVGDGGQGG